MWQQINPIRPQKITFTCKKVVRKKFNHLSGKAEQTYVPMIKGSSTKLWW